MHIDCSEVARLVESEVKEVEIHWQQKMGTSLSSLLPQGHQTVITININQILNCDGKHYKTEPSENAHMTRSRHEILPYDVYRYVLCTF